MVKLVTKYVQWNRNERNITVGPSQQFTPLTWAADDDCTVVSVNVDIALCMEMPTDFGNSSLAGYARLAIYRSGEAIPLVQPNQEWNVGAVAQVDTLQDADSGDTWAIVPFAMSSGSSSSVAALSGGGPGPYVHLKLAPATKRRLRRGDLLAVELNYSNGGNQNTAHQESVTGTLFVQG